MIRIIISLSAIGLLRLTANELVTKYMHITNECVKFENGLGGLVNSVDEEN